MATRDAIPAALRLAIDPDAVAPIYRQIYERVRAAILAGHLPPGARLPSWAGLAGEIGVARGTVKAAYDWLAGEGYIVSRGQAGTAVNPELAQALGPRARRCPNAGAFDLGRARNGAAATASGDAAGDAAQSSPFGPRPVPFQAGVPALDAFPRALWSRLMARAARAVTAESMLYQPPAGHALLRLEIARYLSVARGIAAAPDQIFVTSGFTGALDVVARALMRPGDAVWLEDPGYPKARDGLRLAGARIVPVPVDEEGMVVARGIALCPDARFAVATPSHQSPLGMPLSLTRRIALLDWAAGAESWIIEDDYYGEFRFGGRPVPALKSLDRRDRVIYVGTFAKVLMPSLRLGYAVVPPALVPHFQRVVALLAPSHSPAAQAAVAKFIARGYFGRHIRKMRTLYASRRAALTAALERVFGDRVAVSLEESGMHLIVHLPRGADDREIARRAAAAGLGPTPFSPWLIDADRGPGLILGFANIPAAEAMRQVRRLERIARPWLPAGSRPPAPARAIQAGRTSA